MSILLAIFMFAIWTSVFSISKLTLLHTSPLFLTAIRMLLASFLLLTWLYITKKSELKLKKSHFFSIFLLGLFSIYLTNICEFWSVQHLTAAKTCFIYSLSPLFTAILSYIHFKEKISPKKWLGLLIGLLAVLPVILTKSGDESLSEFISLPALSMIGAALFSVYGWVLLRVVVKDTVSPVTANGYSMLIGGFLALIHSFFIDSWNPLPITNYSSFIQGTVAITFISNILCYNLYGYLLRKFTATFLSFLGLLSPFFASLNGWIIMHEAPSLIIILSSCVVIVGQWIIYKEELRQGYIVKSGNLHHPSDI